MRGMAKTQQGADDPARLDGPRPSYWLLAALLVLLLPSAFLARHWAVGGTALWLPAAGVGFALLVLFGPMTIPLLVAANTFAAVVVGHPNLPLAVVLTVNSASISAMALWACSVRAAGVDLRLRTLRDASVLAVASATATLASAALTTVVLVAWKPIHVWRVGEHLFVAQGAGVLSVAPLLLLAYAQLSKCSATYRNSHRIAELAVLVPIFVIAARLASGGPLHPPLYYPLLIPMVWAALRLGITGTSMGAAVGTCALAAAEYRTGVASEQLLRLEMFMAVFAMAGLWFGAGQSEREDTQRELEASRAALSESEERMRQMATHDPLTGLANRTQLYTRLEQTLAEGEGAVGVLFVDLDGFKQVNDRWGHETGDRVLRTIATRLRSVVRPSDVAARVGGDEFVVLCQHISSDDDLVAIAERVAAVVSEPIHLADREVRVGASIGIARARAGQSAEELIDGADRAMYAHKRTRASRRLSIVK